MNYKTCSKCGESFPATKEFFCVSKRTKDGLQASCRGCQREYRENNLEKENQRSREWKKNNTEKVKQYNREYRKNNLEKIKRRNREYYHENMKDPEFREKCRQRFREYRESNLEKCRQRSREWRKNNLEKRRQQCCDWRKANPDKVNAATAKRKARKLNQSPELTDSEEKRIKLIYKKSHELGSDWQVDHIQPLSKDGLHHPDNLQIVTATYNLEKGSKLNFRPPTETEYFKL